MKLRWIIASVFAIVVVKLALSLFITDPETDDNNQTENIEQQASYNEIIELSLMEQGTCEVFVDMGIVERSSTTTETIRVVNNTATPITLLDFEATCRCTWLDLPRTAIAPGEYADILLTFDSRGEWGIVGNYIAITTSNEDCEVALWTQAEIE